MAGFVKLMDRSGEPVAQYRYDNTSEWKRTLEKWKQLYGKVYLSCSIQFLPDDKNEKQERRKQKSIGLKTLKLAKRRSVSF